MIMDIKFKVKGKEMERSRKLNQSQWQTTYVCSHIGMRMCCQAQL